MTYDYELAMSYEAFSRTWNIALPVPRTVLVLPLPADMYLNRIAVCFMTTFKLQPTTATCSASNHSAVLLNELLIVFDDL